jgi:hypothetical protein
MIYAPQTAALEKLVIFPARNEPRGSGAKRADT